MTTAARFARLLFTLSLFAAAAAVSRDVHAQAQANWPSRPVTLIVPYTAGGASDIGARIVAPELAKQIGQNVVVENVAGAGGALGAQRVQRAQADGHTLIYGSLSEMVLVPLVNPSVGYRTDDFAVAGLAGKTPGILVARPDFPAGSIDELLALVRSSPGRYTYGSPGIGTFQHLVAESIAGRAGVSMVHVPYKGGPQVMQDLMGGQIDLGVSSVPNVAGHLKAGKLKAIGITGSARLASMRELPTLNEGTTIKGVDYTTWAAVFAPAGTPAPVLERINAALAATMAQPAVREKFERLGAEIPDGAIAAARGFVDAEREKYRAVTRSIKLQ